MSADLALLASDPTSLDVYDDPGQQIVLACERANAWLKAGIEVRIETIVETKAQAAAIAAFAIQKQLGHDAELAALEVQRRAERGVALAVKRGQQEGYIKTHADGGPRGDYERAGKVVHVDPGSEATEMSSPNDFFAHSEEKVQAYRLADATDEEFDSAIAKAKAEANLSRANVVRKVKGQTATPQKRAAADPQRLERIQTLASKGWTSAQIAREIGNSEDYVRQLARDNDVDIAADKIVGKGTRRIDSNQVAAEIVATLEGLALPMRLVNFTDLDAAQATEWANSLTESIRALNRFAKQMKELAL
jgi:hypothetical protein